MKKYNLSISQYFLNIISLIYIFNLFRHIKIVSKAKEHNLYTVVYFISIRFGGGGERGG